MFGHGVLCRYHVQVSIAQRHRTEHIIRDREVGGLKWKREKGKKGEDKKKRKGKES